MQADHEFKVAFIKLFWKYFKLVMFLIFENHFLKNVKKKTRNLIFGGSIT